MSLLNNLLSELLSGDSVDALSEKSGANSSQIQQVVQSALPALVQSMVNNAGDEDGANALGNALSTHAKKTAPVSKQVKDADTTDGGKILTHLLGGDKTSVTKNLSSSTGLKSSQVETILASVAPVLLNQIGQSTGEGGSSTDLLGMLSGLLTGSGFDGNDALGSIVNLVMKDGDGDGKPDLLSKLFGLFTGKSEAPAKTKKTAAKKTTTKSTPAKTSTAKKTTTTKKATTPAKKTTAAKKATTPAKKTTAAKKTTTKKTTKKTK